MLNKKSIAALQDIYSNMQSEITSQTPKRNDLERVDKYLQRTTDTSKEAGKGEAARRAGQKNKFTNFEVGLADIYKETAEAYLTGTFLTGNPVFAAVANRGHEDAASMLTALAARDQYRLGWIKELSRCIEDVIKFNRCSCEVLWGNRRAINAATKITKGESHTGSFSPIIYEGNVLRRIDPYNYIYDTTVELHEAHIKGTYQGYFDLLNYIQLKEEFHDWNETYVIKQNIQTVFKSNRGGIHHYIPKIRQDESPPTPANDWSHYWGTNTTIAMTGIMGQYEKFTLYKKIIPREHDLDIPHKGDPQVFKLVYINGHIIYAEPIIAGHEYLPIVTGQLYYGRGDIKSFVEKLFELQDMATASMNASIHAMRRAVQDRALYDPNRIRKADIEAESPHSKIPVQVDTYEQPLGAAYYQIPFQDTVSPQAGQHLNLAFSLTDQTTGLNRSAQGSFIPGNKTVFEFDTIMANAQSRIQLGAIKFEQSFLAPMKEILKLNYLVYSESETIDNLVTYEEIEIDPAMLRDVAPQFKMADGLMPSTKLANTETLVQATQAFATDPKLFFEYDIPGIWMSVMKQQGFTNLQEYKRTPDQIQEYLQWMQLMGGIGAGGAENPPAEE